MRQLGLVMAFTNTERMNFACPRLWTYQHMENFTTPQKAGALTYGIVWHSILEEILEEIKETDLICTEQRLLEILDERLLPLIEEEFLSSGGEELLHQAISFGNVADIEQRIRNCIIGWRISWVSLLERFKIVEVEIPLTAPVLDPRGNIAYFPTYITADEGFWRPSRMGEAFLAELKDLPYYKVGKIDVLLEDRETGDLWICDHKTTSSPAMFENGITYDVQLPSYASLLDWEIKNGYLGYLKGKSIAGVIYDISHSKVSGIPDLLKSGKLSKAKNAGVTSWIYAKAIEHYGLPPSEYKDHLVYLKNNADPKKNYQRFYYLSPEDIDRCADEDYGLDAEMSIRRFELAEIIPDNIIQFNSIAYRYPVCQKYGNCRFSTFCLANTPPTDIMLERDDSIKWVEEISQEQKTQFPF